MLCCSQVYKFLIERLRLCTGGFSIYCVRFFWVPALDGRYVFGATTLRRFINQPTTAQSPKRSARVLLAVDILSVKKANVYTVVQSISRAKRIGRLANVVRNKRGTIL